MRYIPPPMSAAELSTILSYDPLTGEFRWAVAPPRAPNLKGRIAGRVQSRGAKYRSIKIGGKLYMAHRLAWYMSTGKWPENQIDHINCDAADNRLENLREATSAENAANRRKNRNSFSRFKGVCWNENCKRWQAQITSGGRTKYLGLFDSEGAAAAAYRAAADILFGNFARTE